MLHLKQKLWKENLYISIYPLEGPQVTLTCSWCWELESTGLNQIASLGLPFRQPVSLSLTRMEPREKCPFEIPVELRGTRMKEKTISIPHAVC